MHKIHPAVSARLETQTVSLQPDRTDRLDEHHPDFTTLRILILLNPHFYNHLVKYSNHSITSTCFRHRYSIVLRIVIMSILLERDQTFQPKSDCQLNVSTDRGNCGSPGNKDRQTILKRPNDKRFLLATLFRSIPFPLQRQSDVELYTSPRSHLSKSMSFINH